MSWTFGIVLLTGLAVGIWYLWGDQILSGKDGRMGGRPPPPVEVATAARGRVEATVQAVGTVEAVDMVQLTAEVSGKVVSVGFEEGTLVEEGQVLVKLEADEARAELERALAVLEETRRQYERAKAIDTGEYISAAEVDRRRRAFVSAKAEVALARSRLEEYTIKAPFRGRIGLRQVSPGSLVEPGTVVATLSSIDPMRLRFSLPDDLLDKIEIGTPVRIGRRETGGRSIEGSIKSIDSDVDPATRTIAVEAGIPNPDASLRPGMFMIVDTIVEVREDAILIPEEAMLLRAGDSFVFVVDKGRAKRQRVETGARRPGTVEIRNGLKAGQQVIVGGLQQINDGQRITVKDGSANDNVKDGSANDNVKDGSANDGDGAKPPAQSPRGGGA